MTTLFEREQQAEDAYYAAKQAYHTAFNNGVDIGYDAVDSAKSILLPRDPKNKASADESFTNSSLLFFK